MKAAPRPHDAQASRRALLAAAGSLFDELGYDRATVRAIGSRAGVDPALIARYFGSKEGLYIAILAEEDRAGVGRVPDPAPYALARRLLERWGGPAPSPITRALVSPEVSDEVRQLLRGVLDRRLLEPVAEALGRRGIGRARLRAEALVALLLGVALSRENGHFPTLADAPAEEIVDLLAPLLDAWDEGGIA